MDIKSVAAGFINGAVVAGIVAVGMVHAQEVRAEQRLGRVSAEQRECLAKNIFFEARNQSTLGQVSVAWVTLNRMEDPAFPDTICGVVHQGRKDANGNMKRNQCQFSWYCDGKSDRIPNNVVAQRAWEDAQLVADVVLLDWARWGQRESPVENATFYHADYVSPSWARSFTRVATVDDHIFYSN